MSRAQVSSMLPYHFGSFSLVPKTGSRKHPVDKCRSTCLERCGITSLTSKRLVKQALNDCWYLVKLDKEQEGRIEKERERKEQKKRREGGSVGPVGPTCFEEVQAAKLSLRDAERVSLAFSSLSYLSSLRVFLSFPLAHLFKTASCLPSGSVPALNSQVRKRQGIPSSRYFTHRYRCYLKRYYFDSPVSPIGIASLPRGVALNVMPANAIKLSP